MKVLIFAFAVIATVTCIPSLFSDPQVRVPRAASKCSTTPKQWFGYFREIGWDNKDPLKLTFRVANASYNRDAMMLKVMDTKVEFGGPYTVTLYDYKSKQKYEVMNGQCTKTATVGDFPTFGVPSDAKYQTSEYIGSSLPKLGVLVNEYYNIISKQLIYLSSYAPVPDTDDVCIPVLISNLTVNPLAMGLYYFANLTTTLPDDPFSVPKECR